MTKKRAFISFDYENDEFLKIALVGQSNNPDSPFEFADASIKEALTGDWKQKAEARIKAVDLMIVICGMKTDSATGVDAELRIAQANKLDYFLLWGYSEKTCVKPSAAYSSDKVYKWTWPNLKQLIGGAR